jgi:predicted RNA-binding Zn ribbon-like protein
MSTCGRTPKAERGGQRRQDSRERERIREEVRELREITGKLMEGRESHQKPREGSGRRAAPKS